MTATARMTSFKVRLQGGLKTASQTLVLSRHSIQSLRVDTFVDRADKIKRRAIAGLSFSFWDKRGDRRSLRCLSVCAMLVSGGHALWF